MTRLARTYAHGPLSDGRRTHKSIWQKNFLRSRRSSVLSASVRLPLASTQTQLTSWRRAGCGISHSLLASTVSQSRCICLFVNINRNLRLISPLQYVQCTSAKTTSHSPNACSIATLSILRSSCTAASLCCPFLSQVFSTGLSSMFFPHCTSPTVCIYTSFFTPAVIRVFRRSPHHITISFYHTYMDH